MTEQLSRLPQLQPQRSGGGRRLCALSSNGTGSPCSRTTRASAPGELWLDRLQEAVDGCGAFVVLVGRDGVRRWIGAETQVALNRYFGPHDDAERLPIFPILLDGTGAGDAAGVPAAVPDDALERRRSAARTPARRHPRRATSSTKADPVRGLPVRRARRLPAGSGAPVLRPAEGDAGRARLLPTRGRPARRCAGWRSTATPAPASRR